MMVRMYHVCTVGFEGGGGRVKGGWARVVDKRKEGFWVLLPSLSIAGSANCNTLEVQRLADHIRVSQVGKKGMPRLPKIESVLVYVKS